MKAYPHLFAKLFQQPLLLDASVRESFQRQLLGYMQAGGVPVAAVSPEVRAQRVDIYQGIGDVAVIQFHGVVDKQISLADLECYGGLDLNDVDAALSRAATDPKVSTVVLDMHSPGGSVTGVPETAARVASLREKKEVHAYVGTLCCSAAYYIASQCDRIAAAPSARVGSIGVYLALIDESKALEMEGLKVDLIKAGRLKGMGASFKAVTDEERAIFQAEVDGIWAAFKAACTALRDISEEDMQGQSFDGTSAMARKLVDEITGASLDEYVGSLL